MKRTLSFMVMALALLLTQCRKPEVKFPTPSSAEGVTVSMTVTAGPGSKTDITDAGAIKWSSGDKLYVGYDGAYVGCLEIKYGVGTPTGTFIGDVTLTGIPEGTSQTFHFFYLGSNPPEVPSSAQSVKVSFATQTGLLGDLGSCHIGYGTAQGTVVGSKVTGINVTLVSKVALAHFSFKKGGTDYSNALTLGGTHIYNEMTVNFNGSFNHGETPGSISLTGSHSERYVMLVPPADVAAETLNFDGGAGTTILGSGIEANKFYGKNEAIPVTINAYVDLGLSVKWATCNLGATSPGDYGDYYAWGATETWYSAGGQTSSPTWKSGYSDGYVWKHCPGNGGSSSYDSTAFNTWKDANLTGDVLKSGVDAAAAALGDGWRMPTQEEWQALYDNNTFEWLDAGATSQKVTSFKAVAAGSLVVKGGKDSSALDPSCYMFLPYAGFRNGNTSIISAGTTGYYWSNSLSADPRWAFRPIISKSGVTTDGSGQRSMGCTVRPVHAAR